MTTGYGSGSGKGGATTSHTTTSISLLPLTQDNMRAWNAGHGSRRKTPSTSVMATKGGGGGGRTGVAPMSPPPLRPLPMGTTHRRPPPPHPRVSSHAAPSPSLVPGTTATATATGVERHREGVEGEEGGGGRALQMGAPPPHSLPWLSSTMRSTTTTTTGTNAAAETMESTKTTTQKTCQRVWDWLVENVDDEEEEKWLKRVQKKQQQQQQERNKKKEDDEAEAHGAMFASAPGLLTTTMKTATKKEEGEEGNANGSGETAGQVEDRIMPTTKNVEEHQDDEQGDTSTHRSPCSPSPSGMGLRTVSVPASPPLSPPFRSSSFFSSFSSSFPPSPSGVVPGGGKGSAAAARVPSSHTPPALPPALVTRGEMEFLRQYFASIMEDAFLSLDTRLETSEEGQRGDFNNVGCTACVVGVTRNFILCANVGDSCAAIYNADRLELLTRRHRLSDPVEEARVKKAGYQISPSNGRIEGVLAVPRALGDFEFKQCGGRSQREQAVCAVPEVTIRPVPSEGDGKWGILVACDGVWDTLTLHQIHFALTHADSDPLVAASVAEAVIEGRELATEVMRQKEEAKRRERREARERQKQKKKNQPRMGVGSGKKEHSTGPSTNSKENGTVTRTTETATHLIPEEEGKTTPPNAISLTTTSSAWIPLKTEKESGEADDPTPSAEEPCGTEKGSTTAPTLVPDTSQTHPNAKRPEVDAKEEEEEEDSDRRSSSLPLDQTSRRRGGRVPPMSSHMNIPLFGAAANIFAQSVAPADNTEGIGLDNCSLIVIQNQPLEGRRRREKRKER